MRSFLAYFTLLIAIVALDQYSKAFALKELNHILNKGLLLDLFETAPKEIKTLALTGFASLLVLIYSILMNFVIGNHKLTKVALTFLIAGICGNTVDKIIYTHTVDFIPFYKSMFNIADVFLLAGVIILNFILFFKPSKAFSKDNERKISILYPKDQFSFAKTITGLVFGICFILGVLGVVFLKSYIAPVVLNGKSVLSTFAFVYVVMSLIIILLSFVLSLFYSARTAGPIYALEQYIKQKTKRDFKLRDADHYKVIEKIARDVKL